jgi:hypothetical protein
MLLDQHPNYREIKMLLTYCEKRHQKDFADVLKTYDIVVLKVALGLLQNEEYPKYTKLTRELMNYAQSKCPITTPFKVRKRSKRVKKLIEKIGTQELLTACKNKEFNQKAMICIETLKSNNPSLKMQNKAGLSSKKDNELVQNDKTVVQKFPVTTLANKMKLAKVKNSLCCFR